MHQDNHFHGPGLAIRLLCHDKSQEVVVSQEDLKEISNILGVSNDKGYILPIKSVGVQGDARSYKNLAVIVGNGLDLNWEQVTIKAKEITDKIQTINRVAYILNTNKVDGEIKCFNMKIENESVDLLREIDKIVTTNLEQSKANQTFAVLVPIGITKKYSVAIRTFVTNDFMTGRPASIGNEASKQALENIIKEIQEKFSDKIEFIMYDITSKPPATCEWQ